MEVFAVKKLLIISFVLLFLLFSNPFESLFCGSLKPDPPTRVPSSWSTADIVDLDTELFYLDIELFYLDNKLFYLDTELFYLDTELFYLDNKLFYFIDTESFYLDTELFYLDTELFVFEDLMLVNTLGIENCLNGASSSREQYFSSSSQLLVNLAVHPFHTSSVIIMYSMDRINGQVGGLLPSSIFLPSPLVNHLSF